MAGSDELLRMAAEIVDKWSKPLADMRRSLRSLAAETSGAHKAGALQAGAHTEALYKLKRQVVDVGDRLKGSLAPALGAIGITSLSAAAGLAAVVSAVKSFADSSRNLSFLTKETGLSINQLRTLESLAPRIGVGIEQMDEALRGFGENMERLRRSPLMVLRQSFEALNVRPDPQVIASWRALIGSMENLPRSEQLAKVVQYLDRIRDAGQKRAVLKSFGLPPELSRLSGRELQEAIDRIQKIQGTLSDADAKAGKELAESLDDLGLAFKTLRERIGADLAPEIKKIVDELVEWSSVHHKDIADGLRAIGTSLSEVRWGDLAEDAGKVLKVIVGLASSGAGIGGHPQQIE